MYVHVIRRDPMGKKRLAVRRQSHFSTNLNSVFSVPGLRDCKLCELVHISTAASE